VPVLADNDPRRGSARIFGFPAGSGLAIMSCRQSLPCDPVVTELLSPTAG
jgi:hypothetical protein